MKLSICTDVMGSLSFTDMLDKCVGLGVEGIEMTGGGWSPGPHFRADELLADKSLLKSKLKEIEARGLEIAALNCSANPLDPGDMGKRHRKQMEETIRLADEIGVKKIVTMSGLPEAAPELARLHQILARRDAGARPIPVGGPRLPALARPGETGRGGRRREIRARKLLGHAGLEPRDPVPAPL